MKKNLTGSMLKYVAIPACAGAVPALAVLIMSLMSVDGMLITVAGALGLVLSVAGGAIALSSAKKEVAKPIEELAASAGGTGSVSSATDIEEIKAIQNALGGASARNIRNNQLLKRISEGDFSAADQLDTSDETSRYIKELVDNIAGVLSAIRDDVSAVNNGGETVSTASAILTRGTTEQAGTLQELSASINEIKTAVSDNAKNAQAAAVNAEAAMEQVESGTKKMDELLKAMDEINSSTDEIAKFIKVIEDIAFQTNILALNSSVEAARAGEAGKGFAVVAGEVKNLATKSQEAAQKTNDLIMSCVQSVREGSEKTKETAVTFKNIAEKTGEINRGLFTISAACEQQSHSISQVDVGFEQISSVIMETNYTAKECADSAAKLTGHSNSLRDKVTGFSFAKAKSLPKTQPAPMQTAKSEPKPLPKAQPAPMQTVKSEPKPLPKAQPAPMQTVKNEPKPLPKTQPAPVQTVKSEPKLLPKAQPAPMQTVKSEPKPLPKAQPAPMQTVKSEPKPLPKAQPAPTQTVKSEPKPLPKTEPVKSAPAAGKSEVSYTNAEFVDVFDNKY